MKVRASLRRALQAALAALVAVVLLPARAQAFAPKHHLDTIMGPLEGAGFSESEAYLIAFFAIEVDMNELPRPFCWTPIRWHTQTYACAPTHEDLATDPCVQGGRFADWVAWCLPFHNCRLPYALNGFDDGPAYGLTEFTKMRSLWSIEAAMHMAPGERCFDVLRRFGYMLHGIQDFYAHTNWVEVFHDELGFDFKEIPTWTSFMKAQRGAELNLILLQHAAGDEGEAKRQYATLDANLRIGGEVDGSAWHDTYGKDWDVENNYDEKALDAHRDEHNHTVLDYFEEAKFLAGTETYQLGLELKSNIVNNPELGEAAWKRLFDCVYEMAAFEGVSFEDELNEYTSSIRRLRSYSSSLPYVRGVCGAVVSLSFLSSSYPPLAALAALCSLVPNQLWH
ncbi:MAG TPA: hypothetical protein PKO09_10705 [Anaerolineae bacterium]|nr:hypothetical protein [Anaerolineae bacterium]